MVEAAYMAGLYEGEGNISKTSLNGYRIQIGMTDLDVLERFREYAGGVGTISPTKKYQPHHKDSWKLRIGDKQNVARLLSTMLPYLGNRRAYDALNALDDIDYSTRKPIH